MLLEFTDKLRRIFETDTRQKVLGLPIGNGKTVYNDSYVKWLETELFELGLKNSELKKAKQHSKAELLRLFEKHFKSKMINKDFEAFKKSHPTLLLCVLSALEEVDK